MKYSSGVRLEEDIKYMNIAGEVAIYATCNRSKCGAVLVKNNEIIGKGFNTPPANQEGQRKCEFSKEYYDSKVTDKTCCVHAEQRAIMDALKNNGDKIKGSSLYFVRLDEDKKISYSGSPYCTICSKMALDIGVEEFLLWHKGGICVYDTKEYNLISLDYSK